jgi:hypothetical protein
MSFKKRKVPELLRNELSVTAGISTWLIAAL